MLRSSSVAAQLAAPQEGLSSVNKSVSIETIVSGEGRLMNVWHWWDVNWGRGTDVLGDNLSSCHSIPHKSHKTCVLKSNPDCRAGKPATNLVSYGNAEISDFKI
jgi:hypothetical protein